MNIDNERKTMWVLMTEVNCDCGMQSYYSVTSVFSALPTIAQLSPLIGVPCAVTLLEGVTREGGLYLSNPHWLECVEEGVRIDE